MWASLIRSGARWAVAWLRAPRRARRYLVPAALLLAGWATWHAGWPVLAPERVLLEYHRSGAYVLRIEGGFLLPRFGRRAPAHGWCRIYRCGHLAWGRAADQVWTPNARFGPSAREVCPRFGQDINGDGLPEAVVCRSDTDHEDVTYVLRLGGEVEELAALPTASGRLALLDLNHDGTLEVLSEVRFPELKRGRPEPPHVSLPYAWRGGHYEPAPELGFTAAPDPAWLARRASDLRREGIRWLATCSGADPMPDVYQDALSLLYAGQGEAAADFLYKATPPASECSEFAKVLSGEGYWPRLRVLSHLPAVLRRNVNDERFGPYRLIVDAEWSSLRPPSDHPDAWMEPARCRCRVLRDGACIWSATYPGIAVLGWPFGRDANGDGAPDMVLRIESWVRTRGRIEVFALGETIRRVATFRGPAGEMPWCRTDRAGRLIVGMRDPTLAHEKGPWVMHKLKGGRFRPDPSAMRDAAPAAWEQDEWTADARECWSELGRRRLEWRATDMIYAGHWRLAWRFLDQAWPAGEPGKQAFVRELRRKLRASPYWPVVRELNGLKPGE